MWNFQSGYTCASPLKRHDGGTFVPSEEPPPPEEDDEEDEVDARWCDMVERGTV